MPRRRRRNNNSSVKDISENLKKCQISENPSEPNIVLRCDIPREVMASWPKPKSHVPALFLHDPFKNGVVLNNIARILGYGKCIVICKSKYLRFKIKTFETHQILSRYLESEKLPYHTFGHPNTRMMKVVVRNLPVGTDLNSVKEHLQKVSIPVARIHRMHTPERKEHKTMLVLVVLPNTTEGHKMLRVTHILGHEVKLEPALVKQRQCHRCQRWGHSQRYCHGDVKCVKCAGDHLTNKCTKAPYVSPKCANCGGAHTANYKNCSYCPESEEYKRKKREIRNELESRLYKKI